MNNREIPASLLPWDPDNGWADGQFWVANWWKRRTNYLNDGYDTDEIASVCDMLEKDTESFNPNL